jgi:hypothetical protein
MQSVGSILPASLSQLDYISTRDATLCMTSYNNKKHTYQK